MDHNHRRHVLYDLHVPLLADFTSRTRHKGAADPCIVVRLPHSNGDFERIHNSHMRSAFSFDGTTIHAKELAFQAMEWVAKFGSLDPIFQAARINAGFGGFMLRPGAQSGANCISSLSSSSSLFRRLSLNPAAFKAAGSCFAILRH